MSYIRIYLLQFYKINNLFKGINMGLGLWCLSPLSTIFQLCHGSQFYWWRKPEYPGETTDMSHITDQLYQIMLYRIYVTPPGGDSNSQD